MFFTVQWCCLIFWTWSWNYSKFFKRINFSLWNWSKCSFGSSLSQTHNVFGTVVAFTHIERKLFCSKCTSASLLRNSQVCVWGKQSVCERQKNSSALKSVCGAGMCLEFFSLSLSHTHGCENNSHHVQKIIFFSS